MTVARYAKAVAGALVAGLLVLKSAVGDDVVTTAEWIDVAVSVLGSGVLVGFVPNAKPKPDPSHLAGDGRGHT
jgi:hypothetical protein